MLNNSQLIRILLLLLILHQGTTYSLRAHDLNGDSIKHQYWFSKDHPNIAGDDDKWYYCDYKCLTLQKTNPNKDFVVITFKAFLKQKFAACYVKVGSTYTLWSKVTQNAFFEKYCGQDYKDWITDDSWTVEGTYGVGIGTKLTAADQAQMYKK